MEEEEAQMKIEHFLEIVSSLAKCHPDADVYVAYPITYRGNKTTKRGDISGHRTHLCSHPAIGDSIYIEVEGARAAEVENANE